MDILFPSRCVGCGRRGIDICELCLATVQPLGPASCPRCGHPTRLGSVCQACLRREGYLSGIRSACAYDGVARKAIHAFKYRHRPTLAEPLATMVVLELQRRPLHVDILVPVPLHHRRLAERGYNQSTLLAKRLGETLGITVVECLERTRMTVAQARLKATQRRGNVRDAFRCIDNALVEGLRVAVVDDVCTTGATLEDCARALKEAGCASAWGVVVARDL